MRWIVSVALALVMPVVGQDLVREPVATMERLVTRQGRAFESVRVMKVTATEMRIVHKDGAASVRLEDLSPEMQAKFHYDPAAAATVDARHAEIRDKAWQAMRVKEAALMKAKEKRAAKRAAALKWLKDNKYGGRDYWLGGSNWRVRMDVQARSKLDDAGFSKEEIDKIIHEMREVGKREPAPANMHPAFRPRANTEALRGVTEGAQGKPKIKKKPFW